MADDSKQKRAKRSKRIRRTPEEARRVILNAAVKRLIEGGPEALRLQDIASDLGISHPTILHHFGSRDGLIRELGLTALQKAEDELTAALETVPPTHESTAQLIEAVYAALEGSGNARLLAWAAFEPDLRHVTGPGDQILQKTASLIAERRTDVANVLGKEPPAAEDSEFIVRLVTAALLGEAIGGRFFNRGAGHEEDDHQVSPRFRKWLSDLISEHLLR